MLIRAEGEKQKVLHAQRIGRINIKIVIGGFT